MEFNDSRIMNGLKGLVFLLQQNDQCDLHPRQTVFNIVIQVREIAMGSARQAQAETESEK